MRLTLPLNFHGKYHWWGKGWGRKPPKDTSVRRFKMQWMLKSKIKLEEYERTLPSGVEVEDANQYIKRCLDNEMAEYRQTQTRSNFLIPWPYSERPIKWSPTDPEYRAREALVFTRIRVLLDPINQSFVFTNTICDNDRALPQFVVNPTDIEIDDEFMDITSRRLQWCLSCDGIMRKLPLNRQFPYLDQKPPRIWGLPRKRIENNWLRTVYDLSEIYIAQHYGYVDTFKISHPNCVVPFERDNRLVILDLECDFITTAKLSNSLPLFSATPLLTIDKQLASIAPLEWPTCFVESNFYPIDYSFNIGSNHSIHTIFLSHSTLNNITADKYIGRAILYCYGYAIACARKLYGEDIVDKELPDPIPIQCVALNPVDFTVSIVCFQLNTASFTSSIKNQVWISPSIGDTKQIMQNIIALQLNGCVDSITKKIKNSQKVQSIS